MSKSEGNRITIAFVIAVMPGFSTQNGGNFMGDERILAAKGFQSDTDRIIANIDKAVALICDEYENPQLKSSNLNANPKTNALSRFFEVHINTAVI